MTHQDILDYCGKMKGAWLDFPFGNGTGVIKLGSHYFAQIFNLKGKSYLTVKCTPSVGIALRQKYPDWVTRGYHCPAAQQPYNNTVDLEGNVPDKKIYEMIDFSYHCVFVKLTKKEREELRSIDE